MDGMGRFKPLVAFDSDTVTRGRDRGRVGARVKVRVRARVGRDGAVQHGA